MADFQRLQGSVSLGLRAFQSTEGVRRLVAVLEDKIGGTEAGDRQLALLFSLMGENQPMDEISRLVAKVDDARVVRYNVDDPGSGYTRPPLVSVTAGAATDNEPATAKAIIAPTGRVYRLTLEYGGERYREGATYYDCAACEGRAEGIGGGDRRQTKGHRRVGDDC